MGNVLCVPRAGRAVEAEPAAPRKKRSIRHWFSKKVLRKRPGAADPPPVLAQVIGVEEREEREEADSSREFARHMELQGMPSATATTRNTFSYVASLRHARPHSADDIHMLITTQTSLVYTKPVPAKIMITTLQGVISSSSTTLTRSRSLTFVAVSTADQQLTCILSPCVVTQSSMTAQSSRVMSSSMLPAMASSVLPALPSSAMPALPGSALPELISAGLHALPSSALPALTNSALPTLAGSVLPALQSYAVPALPSPILPELQSYAMSALASSVVHALPNSTLSALPSPVLPVLPSYVVPALPTSAVPALPSCALPALPSCALPTLPQLPGSTVRTLTSKPRNSDRMPFFPRVPSCLLLAARSVNSSPVFSSPSIEMQSSTSSWNTGILTLGRTPSTRTSLATMPIAMENVPAPGLRLSLSLPDVVTTATCTLSIKLGSSSSAATAKLNLSSHKTFPIPSSNVLVDPRQAWSYPLLSEFQNTPARSPSGIDLNPANQMIPVTNQVWPAIVSAPSCANDNGNILTKPLPANIQISEPHKAANQQILASQPVRPVTIPTTSCAKDIDGPMPKSITVQSKIAQPIDIANQMIFATQCALPSAIPASSCTKDISAPNTLPARNQTAQTPNAANQLMFTTEPVQSTSNQVQCCIKIPSCEMATDTSTVKTHKTKAFEANRLAQLASVTSVPVTSSPLILQTVARGLYTKADSLSRPLSALNALPANFMPMKSASVDKLIKTSTEMGVTTPNTTASFAFGQMKSGPSVSAAERFCTNLNTRPLSSNDVRVVNENTTKFHPVCQTSGVPWAASASPSAPKLAKLRSLTEASSDVVRKLISLGGHVPTPPTMTNISRSKTPVTPTPGKRKPTKEEGKRQTSMQRVPCAPIKPKVERYKEFTTKKPKHPSQKKGVSEFRIPKKPKAAPDEPLELKKPLPHLNKVPVVAKEEAEEHVHWTQVEGKGPKAQQPWITRAPAFDVAFPPLGKRLLQRAGSIANMRRNWVVPQTKQIETLKLEHCSKPFVSITVKDF